MINNCVISVTIGNKMLLEEKIVFRKVVVLIYMLYLCT